MYWQCIGDDFVISCQGFNSSDDSITCRQPAASAGDSSNLEPFPEQTLPLHPTAPSLEPDFVPVVGLSMLQSLRFGAGGPEVGSIGLEGLQSNLCKHLGLPVSQADNTASTGYCLHIAQIIKPKVLTTMCASQG